MAIAELQSKARAEKQTTKPSELVVGNVCRYWAKIDPDKIALQDDTSALTYADLDRRATIIAEALVGRGIAKGDVVSAYLPNCLEYVLIVLAVARVGAVFSPINPRFKSRELGDILKIAKPRAVFTARDKLSVVTEALRRADNEPLLVLIDDEKRGAISIDRLMRQPGSPLPEIDDSDFFSLMFTSGTTGRPKGALATHRARMVWVLNAAVLYGLERTDVYLGTMPQVHSAGLTFTLMHLHAGSKILILRDFDARRYLESVERKKVTSSLMVPTMLAMILEELASGGKTYELSSFKRLVTCGSPLPLAIKEKVLGSVTDQLYDYYGSTESNSMSVLLPKDQIRKPTSVGQAFPGVEIRIADDVGNWLPSGKVGEICCKNPSVMTCYFEQPKETTAAFREGWYRTGDLGFLDDEAYLHLVGRSVDTIISGGVNIYPAEIEQVLMEHPGILDCAIVGEPDPKWGQCVVAYIVPRKNWSLDLAAIQAHCAQELADYKKPRRAVFLAEIPKNAGGKTIKSALAGPGA